MDSRDTTGRGHLAWQLVLLIALLAIGMLGLVGNLIGLF